MVKLQRSSRFLLSLKWRVLWSTAQLGELTEKDFFAGLIFQGMVLRADRVRDMTGEAITAVQLAETLVQRPARRAEADVLNLVARRPVKLLRCKPK